MNKNDGVAGGDPAETLAEDVHTQQESPPRCHCLTYLKLSFLLVMFQYLCTWKEEWGGMAVERWQHVPATYPPSEWRFVSSQSSTLVQHALVAKYVRVGSTWWFRSCVCEQRETGVCGKAPPPFLCAATALAKVQLVGLSCFRADYWAAAEVPAQLVALKTKHPLFLITAVKYCLPEPWVWPCSFQDRQNVRFCQWCILLGLFNIRYQFNVPL